MSSLDELTKALEALPAAPSRTVPAADGHVALLDTAGGVLGTMLPALADAMLKLLPAYLDVTRREVDVQRRITVDQRELRASTERADRYCRTLSNTMQRMVELTDELRRAHVEEETDKAQIEMLCRENERITARLNESEEKFETELLQHNACLHIARGEEGWDQERADDSPSMLAVRQLRMLLHQAVQART